MGEPKDEDPWISHHNTTTFYTRPCSLFGLAKMLPASAAWLDAGIDSPSPDFLLCTPPEITETLGAHIEDIPAVPWTPLELGNTGRQRARLACVPVCLLQFPPS